MPCMFHVSFDLKNGWISFFLLRFKTSVDCYTLESRTRCALRFRFHIKHTPEGARVILKTFKAFLVMFNIFLWRNVITALKAHPVST
jgi:hypothetical protein